MGRNKMDTAQTLFTLLFPITLLIIARAYRAWREAREAQEEALQVSPLAQAFINGEAPWQSAQVSPLAQAFINGEAPWQVGNEK